PGPAARRPAATRCKNSSAPGERIVGDSLRESPPLAERAAYPGGQTMKAWRFHAFNDMRLDDVPTPVCTPGHVLVEPLCVQPSITEAQLALGIPTLAYDRIKRRLET